MQETFQENAHFRARVRVMQIIAGALVMGVLIFLGIVVFLVSQDGPFQDPPQEMPILTYIALGLGALQIMMWSIIPGVMAESAGKQLAQQHPEGISDVDRFLGIYQTKMIIAYALLEAAAFLACIAYLMEGELVALGVVGVMVLLMLISFPTRDRVRIWVEKRLRRADAL